MSVCPKQIYSYPENIGNNKMMTRIEERYSYNRTVAMLHNSRYFLGKYQIEDYDKTVDFEHTILVQLF